MRARKLKEIFSSVELHILQKSTVTRDLGRREKKKDRGLRIFRQGMLLTRMP